MILFAWLVENKGTSKKQKKNRGAHSGEGPDVSWPRTPPEALGAMARRLVLGLNLGGLVRGAHGKLHA